MLALRSATIFLLSLWCSFSFPGANASTAQLVTDLNPGATGSYPSNFTTFQNSLFFSAYTLNTGIELWRFDGTNVTLVSDINPTADDIGFGVLEGNDSLPAWLTPWGDRLFFSAYEPRRGAELWSYSSAGVARISDIAPDVNDTIKVLPNNAWPAQLTVFNNALYFSATTSSNIQNYELWQYDGVTVRQTADIHPASGTNYSSFPTGLTAFGESLYFSAYDGTHGWELYRHGGTTPALIDINPGGEESSSFPKFFTAYGNDLYFQAYTDASGFELWKVNGSTASQVVDLYPGEASSYPQHLTAFNGALYFSASDPLSGTELRRYDGSSITLVSDINENGDAYPKNLTVFNGRLIFAADDGVHGWELWSFNGTAASLLADLNPIGDSYPESLTVVGGILYFSATSPETGYELFQFDGQSVSLATDINLGPGDSFPRFLHDLNRQLVFSAAQNGTSDWELWVIREPATSNAPPLVSLLSPVNGASFVATDSITVAADATDNGSIAKVEFFANENLIDTDTTAPYSVNAILSAGSYSLSARATDNLGATTTSAPIAITVTSPNQPPSVTLTAPVEGATFLSTDIITIRATATDDGNVAKVEFFTNGTLMETDTTTPYSMTTTLAVGNYSLTARATDNLGVTTTAAPIAITVASPNQPPSVTLTTPAEGATFLSGENITISATATDDGSVAKVEFFTNGTLVGTDATAPYSLTLTLPAGSHSLTAKAADNVGTSTISAPVAVTVTPPDQTLTVSISPPTNGAPLSIEVAAPEGSSVTLQATTNFIDWTGVSTATSTGGTLTFTYPFETSLRFFRVVIE